MFFQYETENLMLRVLDENKAGPVLDFYIEGDEYFGVVEPERPNGFFTVQYQKKVLFHEMEYFVKGERARYYAFLKSAPTKIIGTVSLFDFKREPYFSAMIGYKMLKDYTGRGYATEMVRKITEAAFFDSGLHRVDAFVQPGNASSIRVLEKVGYENEGLAKSVIKIGDKWLDHYRYACINTEDE